MSNSGNWIVEASRLACLENDAEEPTRLRSSSLFTGILTVRERAAIFAAYRGLAFTGRAVFLYHLTAVFGVINYR